MPGLVLKLRSGDGLIINGAALRFRTRTIVEIPAKADLLYGKQILAPEEATTPARRLYAALQNAYITSGRRALLLPRTRRRARA
jgi:flagellar protein FlbT